MRAGRLVHLLLLAVLAGLASYTWAHWGSPRIDCGRELYVPARLLEGELLYRDVWYPYGPLAPYLQAGMFRLFGVRLEALYALGLALTYGCAAFVFAVGRRLVGVVPALLVSVVFLFLACVPRIFNFVFGYSGAASLGAFLGLACVYALMRHALGERGPNLACAGLAAGLALVCKQEFGAGCWLAVGFVLALEALAARSRAAFLGGLLACLPGLALVVLVLGAFLTRVSLDFLLFENFTWVPGSTFFESVGPMWVRARGLRFLPHELAFTTATAAVCLVAWYGVARLWRRALDGRKLAALALAALAAVALAGYGLALPASSARFYKTLSVFPIGMFWISLGSCLRDSLAYLKAPSSRPLLARAAAAAYAVGTGIRVMVQMEPSGYSLYYTTVPYLIFVCCLVEVMRRGLVGLAPGRAARVVSGLLALQALATLAHAPPRVDRQQVPLHTPVGLIYAYPPYAEAFAEITSFMRRERAAGRRVAVMPEDVFLYVASGMQAPTRWHQIAVGLLGPTQEQALIAEMEHLPVQHIVVTNLQTPEYGKPVFGRDYYVRLYRWIEANYEVVREFGRFEQGPGVAYAARLYARRRPAPPAALLDVPKGP